MWKCRRVEHRRVSQSGEDKSGASGTDGNGTHKSNISLGDGYLVELMLFAILFIPLVKCPCVATGTKIFS